MSRYRKFRLLGASTIICLVPLPGIACAQSSNPPAPSPPAEDPAKNADAAAANSGDIVVTARRREESAQSVPLSISAFSGNTLASKQVGNLQEVSQIAVGLTTQQTPQGGNSAPSFAIRGQRQGAANILFDSPVSIYVDEVIAARAQGTNDALFDLQNVQVLKGPQGTLFGRNSTGGAILITSQIPKDHFEGYADLTVGTYGLARGEAVVNVPLGDAVQLRAGGVITRRDGYTSDPTVGHKVDNQRTESWRASLRIAPGDIFENRLVANGFHENDDGPVIKITSVGAPTSPAVGLGAAADLAFLATQPFHTAVSDVYPSALNVLGISNITTLHLGSLTLKGIGGFRHVQSSIAWDADGTSVFVADSQLNTNVKQYSYEAQALGSAFGDQLSYTMGLYFFQEKGTELQTIRTASPLRPGIAGSISDNDVTSKSIAAYGQLTYKPDWLENVSFTGGLRYTKDTRDFTARNRLTSGVCSMLTADSGGVPLNPCIKQVGVAFEKPSYTLSVDWKATEKLLLYVTHRYGYQAGGFTNNATRPSTFEPYRPQTVHDFEVGMKSRWVVGQLIGQTNIALYRGSYKNIQRLVVLPALDGGASFRNLIINAASSIVQGIDFDQTFQLGSVRATIGYAYLDAHYTSYVLAGQDYTNSDFSGSPKHTVTGSLRWELPVAARTGSMALEVSGFYQSSSIVQETTSFNPVTQTNFPSSIINPYTIINSQFSWDRIAGQPLTLTLFVKNLFNEKYLPGGFDLSQTLGASWRSMGPPRTAGVRIRYTF